MTATVRALRTDPDAVAWFFDAINDRGDVREIRIPDSKRGPGRLFGTVSGYFDDSDAAAQALESLTGDDADAVFITLNPVNPELLARSVNRLKTKVKATTSDADIVRRQFLLVDCDPVRPAGLSATDDEMLAATRRRDMIATALTELYGWASPSIETMSGNGGGLIYRIDEPNDAETTSLITRVLAGMAALFNDEIVTIDTAVYNAARITKIPGTIAAKGDDTDRRPWRVATASYTTSPGTVSRAMLEAVAAEAPVHPARRQPSGAATRGDVVARDWTVDELLALNGLHATAKPWNGGTAYLLDHCLTSADHQDGARLIEMASGALVYTCHHNRCQGKGWQYLRENGIVQIPSRTPRTPTIDIPTPKPATNGNGAHHTNGHSEIPPVELPPTDEVSSFIRFSPISDETNQPEKVPAEPFPLSVLPPAPRQLVSVGALAIGAPPDMIATPLLAYAAGAIGNRVSIQLKPGFVQRPQLYAAVVAPPGSAKSPSQDLARAAIDSLQRDAHDRYLDQVERFEGQLEQWHASDPKFRGTKPAKPVMDHLFTTDATIEALGPMIERSPGIVISRDELSSWVKSFDAYRSGKGGDRQTFLSLWAGSPVKIDRKGGHDTIYVPDPSVSVVGGIQPDMLTELADEAGRQDGMIDRIIWSYPDPRPATWTDEVVEQHHINAVISIFQRLRQTPKGIVKLSPVAKTDWVEWFNENAALTETMSGLMQGVYAKLPNINARLALILHCLTYPDAPIQTDITRETLQGAIALTEYYRSHAHRVLPHFGAAATSSRGAGVVQRIALLLEQANGEWVGRTEISRGLGRNVKSDEITAALQTLASRRHAESRMGGSTERGGRPTEEWRSLLWGITKKRTNLTLFDRHSTDPIGLDDDDAPF